ncbi:MAG: hypothetical protein M1829_001070 [Trizodia sp. TS-e1964]|nr:MAG: hypothetical protein M1829_001070 [Trizodia sp. TS-e1964]
MAKNLRSKIPSEDPLYVYDLNAGATKKFQEEDELKSNAIRIAASPREVAENAEIIITVLPEPSHVRAVFSEILAPPLPTASVPHKKTFIDCSTIDPNTSRNIAKAVDSTQQATFVDAPMSGGVVGARAGSLTFMLGAPESLVPTLTNILYTMGSTVLHCGPQGAGLCGKLANNYLLAINNIATAEAMHMGIQWGLEPKVLANLINASTGKCWPSEVNNPVPGVVGSAPASRGYKDGFGTGLMKKDLGLAIKAAEDSDVKLVLGEKAYELYDAVQKDENCAGRDFSVVYRYLGGKE